MSSLDDIGAYCALEACSQQDFLPFTCARCNLQFCREHASPEAHQCTAPDLGEVPDAPHDASRDPNRLRCCVARCLATEFIHIRCQHCNEPTCLAHRQPEEHSCTQFDLHANRLQRPDASDRLPARSGATQQLRRVQPRKRPLTEKQRKMAAKVAKIKLRMHATGRDSIPQNQRFYLKVTYENEESKPLFFDRGDVIGRVLDVVAQAGRVPNRNGSTMDRSDWLWLVNSAGDILPMNQTLASLEPLLFDGDEVMLVRGAGASAQEPDPGESQVGEECVVTSGDSVVAGEDCEVAAGASAETPEAALGLPEPPTSS